MTRRMVAALLAWLAVQSCAALVAGPEIRQMSFLSDPTGTETITSVASANQDRFRPVQGPVLARGYTAAALWLRLELAAPAGDWWLDVLPPILDDLRLYELDPASPEGFRERRSGDELPFSHRELNYRGFVFKLRHDSDAPRTYYLRLQTSSSAILFPRVWSPDDFVAQAALEQGLLAGYLAILLAVVLVNLGALSWLNDTLMRWFLAYTACLATNVAGVGGFFSQYAFPDQPRLCFYLVSLSTLGSVALGFGFYRQLFMIDRSQPVVYWSYEAGIWLMVLGVGLTFLGLFPVIMPWVWIDVTLASLVGCALAVRQWRRGIAGGGMALLANLISMAGLLAVSLNLQGLLSSSLVLIHGLPISSLGAALALQSAVGARHRNLVAERARALEVAERERQVREQQSQFFSMLSHEVKTPLAVIDSAVQVLQQMGTQADQAVARRYARIRHAVHRIDDLIVGALRHDRFGSASPERMEPVSLSPLLTDTLEAFGQPQKRLVLQASPCGTVLGDRDLLRGLFAALIDNALKYSPPEQPVVVRLRQEASDAIVEVSDRGPGIPPAERDQIFGRYVRGGATGHVPGLGLGLHIVQQIAGQHRGRVEVVASPDGIGAVFRVTIPVGPAA